MRKLWESGDCRVFLRVGMLVAVTKRHSDVDGIIARWYDNKVSQEQCKFFLMKQGLYTFSYWAMLCWRKKCKVFFLNFNPDSIQNLKSQWWNHDAFQEGSSGAFHEKNQHTLEHTPLTPKWKNIIWLTIGGSVFGVEKIWGAYILRTWKLLHL